MSNALMLTAASEINKAHAQAVRHAETAIDFAKHAGELLLKVKCELAHGEFLPWLAANCTVSDRQAQRYMAAAQGKPLPIRTIKNDTVSYLPGMPNWRDCTIDRSEHPGYDRNPFSVDDLEQALVNVATPLLHKNLDLARELVTQFIADTTIMVDGNQHLLKMLDGGDEYEVLPIPGDTLHGIVDELKTLLKLANEPLVKGRSKDKDAAAHQREKIALLVRTVLALLGDGKAGVA